MSVNIYARMTKLTDVVGRIDYISNPARQENLLGTGSTTVYNPDYWRQLAADSQAAWRQAGGHRPGDRCCEAREIHGDLPNCALNHDMDTLATRMAAMVLSTYGVDCSIAIHLNKAKNNLHYHMVISERRPLGKPELRLADRNVWLDERGVRRRTKKEILDDAGQLRPGCRIIHKGEVLQERYFGAKEPIFADRGWLQDYKADIAAWINDELQPDEVRTVFDAAGPYLAQQHVGKGIPMDKAAAIRDYNAAVRIYNRAVRDGQITENQAQSIKTQVMIAPDRLTELRAAVADLEIESGRTILHNTRGDSLAALKQGRSSGLPQSDKSDMSDKELLREAYRTARKERQDARMAITPTERRQHQAAARQASAQIDIIKCRLGIWSMDDVDREIRRQAQAQSRQQRRDVLSRRRRGELSAADAKRLYRTARQMALVAKMRGEQVGSIVEAILDNESAHKSNKMTQSVVDMIASAKARSDQQRKGRNGGSDRER